MLRIAAAMLVVLSLVAPPVAAQGQLDAQQRAWIDGHGPIRYGYEPFYAPFEFEDRQGDPAGINFDLLDAMARNLGIQIEKIQYPNFTALQDALRAGDIDVLGSINKTAERDAWMDFSDPYVRLSSVFYVTDRHPDLHGIDDLQGLRVGVIGAYVSAEWLAGEHPSLDLHPYAELDAALAALATGDIDALFEESATVGYMVRENAYTNIRVLDAGAFLESDQHFVVLDGQDSLVGVLNDGLASVSPGDKTKIFEYWTGYDLGVAREPAAGISPLARNVILGIAGAFVLVGAWSIALRQQVKRKTRDLRQALRRREEAETEVRHLNQDLEARVEQRTQQLERSNRDLEEFAKVVSHDLQNPLNAIGLNLAIVDQVDLPPPQRRASLKAREYTTRMRDLIIATLDFARAGGDAPMHATDLTSVVQAATSDLEAAVEESGAKIIVGALPRVHGNPMQLKRLFENLLGNAIKYRRPGEVPVIRVEAEQEDGHWTIHVVDNGLGFTGESSHLQGLFVREHTDIEGHGIGLAACARILARHGGRLEAEGRPGEGSTFTVRLPG